MDPREVLERMADPTAPTPAMSDLGAVYALLVASISDRMEPDELESFIALGVAIQRQGVVRIPIAAIP